MTHRLVIEFKKKLAKYHFDLQQACEWSAIIDKDFKDKNHIFSQPPDNPTTADLQNCILTLHTENVKLRQKVEQQGTALDNLCKTVQLLHDGIKDLRGIAIAGFKRRSEEPVRRSLRSRSNNDSSSMPDTHHSPSRSPSRTPRNEDNTSDIQSGNDLDTISNFASDINDIAEEETISTPSRQGALLSILSPGDVTVFKDLSNLQIVDALDTWYSKKLSFSANANWTVLDVNGLKCSKNKSKFTTVIKFCLDKVATDEQLLLSSDDPEVANQRALALQAVTDRAVKALEDYKISKRQNLSSKRKWSPTFNHTITAMYGILQQMLNEGYSVPHSQVSRSSPGALIQRFLDTFV